jgi:hypothetical protein
MHVTAPAPQQPQQPQQQVVKPKGNMAFMPTSVIRFASVVCGFYLFYLFF